MADFRNMNRGGPGPMMRPIGPGPPMMAPVKQPIFPTLCPDFLKGVCSVFQCPKNHPEASLLFCQAYQRDLCQQGQSCAYMHATAEEEQYYKDTGLIPLRFMNKPIRIERGKGPLPNGQPSLFPSENSIASPVAPTPVAETPTFPVVETPAQPTPEPIADKHKITDSGDTPGPVLKRQKISYEELEAERNMLKEKIKILEKKVEQLDAANDVLLEKNAKIRSSSKRSPDRSSRRSPDKDHSRSRRDRRSRDRRSRDRSKERNKDQGDAGWKDNNSRGGGGGGRWNDGGQYNNYNRQNNIQSM